MTCIGCQKLGPLPPPSQETLERQIGAIVAKALAAKSQQEESPMAVRAKFYVSKLEEYPGSTTNVGLKPVMPKYNNETRQYEESENKSFWDATPSGDIALSIKAGSAAEFFKRHLGKEVYVDFTPADGA